MGAVVAVTSKIAWKPIGASLAKLMLATLAGYAAQSAVNKAFDSVVKVKVDETQEEN